MKDTAYSAIIDAIIFLAMVSAGALILSAAIAGNERQRAASDASLRAEASSLLISMETVRADHFEYRILGDQADTIAEKCGIDPGAWLYRDVTNAVLGRGNRHKAIMEIAAEAAACQFTLRQGDRTLRLDPMTGDYGSQAQALVASYLEGRLDSRYAYHFTLRWAPFAGVPFEGSISCGDPEPPGAASASVPVTLPYRTEITKGRIEEAIAPDVAKILDASAAPVPDKARLRALLGECLENASRPMVKEVLGNTIYEVLPANDAGNPLALLATFSDNDSTAADPMLDSPGFDVESILCDMVVRENAASLDALADYIVSGVDNGTMSPDEERPLIVRWMCSRYNPSGARATFSVWVNGHA